MREGRREGGTEGGARKFDKFHKITPNPKDFVSVTLLYIVLNIDQRTKHGIELLHCISVKHIVRPLDLFETTMQKHPAGGLKAEKSVTFSKSQAFATDSSNGLNGEFDREKSYFQHGGYRKASANNTRKSQGFAMHTDETMYWKDRASKAESACRALTVRVHAAEHDVTYWKGFARKTESAASKAEAQLEEWHSWWWSSQKYPQHDDNTVAQ